MEEERHFGAFKLRSSYSYRRGPVFPRLGVARVLQSQIRNESGFSATDISRCKSLDDTHFIIDKLS